MKFYYLWQHRNWSEYARWNESRKENYDVIFLTCGKYNTKANNKNNSDGYQKGRGQWVEDQVEEGWFCYNFDRRDDVLSDIYLKRYKVVLINIIIVIQCDLH